MITSMYECQVALVSMRIDVTLYVMVPVFHMDPEGDNSK